MERGPADADHSPAPRALLGFPRVPPRPDNVGVDVRAKPWEMEEALLARLRAGDEAAFAVLVDDLHGRLVALAMTFTSSPPLAEDIAQETWLAVIRAFARMLSLPLSITSRSPGKKCPVSAKKPEGQYSNFDSRPSMTRRPPFPTAARGLWAQSATGPKTAAETPLRPTSPACVPAIVRDAPNMKRERRLSLAKALAAALVPETSAATVREP